MFLELKCSESFALDLLTILPNLNVLTILFDEHIVPQTFYACDCKQFAT